MDLEVGLEGYWDCGVGSSGVKSDMGMCGELLIVEDFFVRRAVGSFDVYR